jgi:hypothetical protein
MRAKRITKDRKQQVATTLKRHGSDHYEKIGAKAATFKDPKIASLAAWKRWHPEDFDEEGNLIEGLNDADQRIKE